LLEAKDLTFTYGAGTPFEKKAVDGVSLSAQPGQFLGLIGHTGSGKSTLIQHLNGLLRPQSGKVFLDGKDIWEKKGVSLRTVRFEVGLVFQYPEYQLFEETVERDIAFGPRAMGLDEAEISERVGEAMDFVGLDSQLAQKSPFDLSGGQKRRTAIAGVMAMRPRFLVLDEPTAGLDPAGRQDILRRVTRYSASTGAAVVLATHSMEDIARMADDILVLANARAALHGPLSQVFRQRERLLEIGLDVPAVTRVLLRLRAMGFRVNTAAYTLEDAAKAIKAATEAC